MDPNASNLGSYSAIFGPISLGYLNDIWCRNNVQQTLYKKVHFSIFNGRFSDLTS